MVGQLGYSHLLAISFIVMSLVVKSRDGFQLRLRLSMPRTALRGIISPSATCSRCWRLGRFTRLQLRTPTARTLT